MWPGSCQSSSASRCLSDRLFALRVVTFAAVVPLLMRLPIDRLARWIKPSGRRTTEPPPRDVFALVATIDQLLLDARPFVKSRCLTRGVTLYRFLRRAGADVSLRFGVGRMDGAIAAHCWIVYQGEPLAERRDPRAVFTEMWTIAS
jgi:transglutaminase superfamily protein